MPVDTIRRSDCYNFLRFFFVGRAVFFFVALLEIPVDDALVFESFPACWEPDFNPVIVEAALVYLEADRGFAPVWFPEVELSGCCSCERPPFDCVWCLAGHHVRTTVDKMRVFLEVLCEFTPVRWSLHVMLSFGCTPRPG